MSLKKVICVLVILAVGAWSIAALRGSSKLESWIQNLSPNGEVTEEAPSADKVDDRMPVMASELPQYDDESFPPFPSQVEIPATPTPIVEEKTVVLPTTIEGGMVIRNDTGFQIDLDAMVRAGPSLTLSAEGMQVLIIHTHGSEAFTPDEKDNYTPTDGYRSDDKQFNVIRLGDELTSCLESFGLNVIHDREIYDYPSYTGSYDRSGYAIEEYLSQYPEIAVVIDLHRDALGSNGIVYKTMAEGQGAASSQVMLLVGTGENGRPHPIWSENMKFALYLQSAIVNKYPTLARPVAVKKERYNQQLTTGSLILEVGSSGNTLSEALQAVRFFADAVAPALLELKSE